MGDSPRYATLLYDVRSALGISIQEYFYLDMVYFLSRKTGWCFKSLTAIADDMGMKKNGVMYLRDRLVEQKLLERNAKGHVRTTQKYEDIAIINRGSVQKLNDENPQTFKNRTQRSKIVPQRSKIERVTGGENNKRKTVRNTSSDFDLENGEAGNRGAYSPAKERLRQMVQAGFRPTNETKPVETLQSPQNTQGDGDPTLGTRSRDKRAAASRMLANPAQYPGRDGLALFLEPDAVVRDGDGRR